MYLLIWISTSIVLILKASLFLKTFEGASKDGNRLKKTELR